MRLPLLFLLLFILLEPTHSLGPKKNRKNKNEEASNAQECPQCEVCKDCPSCPEAPVCPSCPSCPVSQSDFDTVTSSLKSQTTKLIESDEKFSTCTKSLRTAESAALHLEKKLTNVKDSLGSELTSKGTKLAEKEAEVKRLNARVSELQKELTDVKKEHEDKLVAAAEVGTGVSKYCNFTLVREDGEAFYEIGKERARDKFEVAKVWTVGKGEETILLLQSYSSDLKSTSISLLHSTSTFLSETQEASKVYQVLALDALNECVALATPYIDLGVEKAKSAYESNLKEVVDDKVIPVYKDHLEGHVENARVKAVEFYGEVKPLVIEGGEMAREEGRKVRLSVKSMIEEGAKVSRKRYNSDNEGEGIDAILKVMESDGEFVIDSLLYVILAYLFYLYAYGTVKFVLRWTVWYPIRIVFWPLFIFGGSKKKKSAAKEVPN